MKNLLEQICNEPNIDEAYLWLCKQRIDYSANPDIWYVRQHWNEIKPVLINQLKYGNYEFSPLQQYRFDDENIAIWAACDSLVLKAIQLVLSKYLKLKLHSSCTHIKGNGGLTYAVNSVNTNIKQYKFFLSSDVLKYYASINHNCLIQELHNLISDKRVVNLIARSLDRVETYGGLFYSFKQGISLASPLSPLLVQ
jgi:RNA-directed DNA polymerase